MARGQLFTVKGQPILAGPSGPPPTVGSPRPSLVGRGHGARTEPRQPRAPVRPRPAPRMLADGNPNRSCGKEALRQPCRDPQNSRPSSLSAEGPPGHPLASIQFLAQTQKLAPNVRQPDTTCYRHDTDSAGSSFYLCVCVCVFKSQNHSLIPETGLAATWGRRSAWAQRAGGWRASTLTSLAETHAVEAKTGTTQGGRVRHGQVPPRRLSRRPWNR